MLQDLGGDDAVERPRRRRAGGWRRPARCRRSAACVDLAGLGHGPEGVAHLLELGVGVVEGHDARPARGRFEGVAAEPATEIEQPVAGLQARGGRSGR